jgi:hypothetical protein
MGGTSLFIGALCGQFAAMCMGLVGLGHRHLLSFPSRDSFPRAAISAPTTAASGLVDGTRGFGENALPTSTIDLHAVGILSHARLYHGLLMALADAVGHNLWAKSLEEARSPHSGFEMTRSACGRQKLRRSALTDPEHFRLTREYFRRSAPRDGARTWSVVSAQTSVT